MQTLGEGVVYILSGSYSYSHSSPVPAGVDSNPSQEVLG